VFALTSFPTRRSSDLQIQIGGIQLFVDLIVDQLGNFRLQHKKPPENNFYIRSGRTRHRRAAPSAPDIKDAAQRGSDALPTGDERSEEHTSELQSRFDL